MYWLLFGIVVNIIAIVCKIGFLGFIILSDALLFGNVCLKVIGLVKGFYKEMDLNLIFLSWLMWSLCLIVSLLP